MNTQAEPLFQFIFDYELRIEKLVIFDAVISFCKDGEPCQVKSEIQIIILADPMTMHIVEFQKPKYKRLDKYSIAEFRFAYTRSKLSVMDDNNEPLLSIAPVN